jgi:signal transduction histidine kinase
MTGHTDDAPTMVREPLTEPAAPANAPRAGGPLRRAIGGWTRDVAFLGGASVTAIVAVLVWNLLVPAAIVLAIIVIGLPAAVLLAGIWRRLIDVDRAMVAARDGRPITVLPAPSAAAAAGDRFGPALRLLGSRRFWLDLLWLTYQATAGITIAITALSLPIAAGAFWAILAAGGRSELVDLLRDTDWAWASELRPVLVAGAVLTLLALLVIPVAARLHTAIGRVLLFDRDADLAAGGGPGAPAGAGSPDAAQPGGAGDGGAAAGDGVGSDAEPARNLPSAGDLLAGHVAVVAAISLLMLGVWLLDGAGTPVWPVWVWFAGGCTIGLHVLGIRSMVVPRLVLLRDGIAAMSVACLAIWAFSGAGEFWPRWPIAAGWALYGVLRLGPYGETWARTATLRTRIDELTTSRREVVDTQAEELRRIERDLHDGAQARLVALSMQLGRAEAKLAADERPEAELVSAARKEALAAIGELRDLARGIAPPILQARGLVAAVQALADRTPVEAQVRGVVEPRPSAAVESCAYFVCAESLTNVAKHAQGARAELELAREGDLLRVVVRDDGPGGAVLAGGGLEGLRRRVAALDGRLVLESPAGGGTTVTVELPCAS